MSITTYIQTLKEEKNLSYLQLSKESKISYGNIMDIKNGRIAFPTESILKKLSKYLDQEEDMILFEIVKDDYKDTVSDTSLRYLCNLYTNGYSVVFDAMTPDPFRTKYMHFDGYAYKKRSGNTLTVVDSWEKIKKEHWTLFKAHNNIPFDRDAWINVFMNEDMYVSNIVYFEICRVLQSEFKNLKELVITYDNNDPNVKYAQEYISDRYGFKIKFITDNNF